MDWNLNIINSYLFVSVMLTAFCAMYSLVRRRSMLHVLFSFLCLCIMIYTFGYMMEINVTTMNQMIFWNLVQYFGIPFFPSIWVLFVLAFTKHRLIRSRWFAVSIFIIPFTTLFFRITNDVHHLFYKSIDTASFTGFSVLALEKGPWYFVQAVFVTIAIFFGAYLLIRHSWQTPRNEKIMYYMIVLITLIPLLGVIVNLFNIWETYLDYTAFSTPIVALLLFSVIFSNDLLKLKSFARDKLFENSKDGILLLDRNWIVLDFNTAARNIFPKLTSDHAEMPLSGLLDINSGLFGSIRSKTKCQIEITTGRQTRHFYANTADILSNGGRLAGYSVTFSDITEIIQATRQISQLAVELAEEKNLLMTTLLSVGDGVISTDTDAKVILMNPVAERLTGWNQREAAGHPAHEILHLVNAESNKDEINPVYKVLEMGCAFEADENTFLHSRSGNVIPIEDSAAPIRNADGIIIGAVIVFRDYSEKKKRKEIVEYLSFHDQLTGIFNRRYFEEKAAEIEKQGLLPISLVMADVNGLKLANDAFGHATGDMLLKAIARIIQSRCRPGDLFARMGGDEFVILLPNTAEEQAEETVRNIQEDMEGQHVRELEVSVSFGWDTRTNINRNISDIYKKAEESMYNRKLVESPAMRKKTIRRIVQSLQEEIPDEREHAKNVAFLSKMAGMTLGLTEVQQKELQIAGEMHDIGKIAIDYRVINHSGSLSESDWLEVKRHAELGYRILGSVNDLVPIAEIVLAHHENWDGSGYPKGLSGNRIPLASRIIRIADSYDAMTHDRIYRKSLGDEAAKEELIQNAGIQYDPEMVRLFLEKIL